MRTGPSCAPPSRAPGSSAPSMRTRSGPPAATRRGRRRLDARALAGRGAAPRRGARPTTAPRTRRRPRRRRRPHLHAEPPARGPLRPGARWTPASTSSARSRSALDADGAQRLVDAAADAPACGRRAVRLPLLPDRPRGPRPRRARARAAPCISPRRPTCRTGCCAPRTTTGASTPALGGASRAFADIGSHWCDLAEFVTGQRITRLCARARTTAVPERRAARGRAAFARGDGDGELRPVATEDAARRAVRDRRRRARLGRRSARSRPAARTGSGSRSTPPRRRSRSTRRTPSRCGSAGATARDRPPRPRHAVAGGRAPTRSLPAGHPQGYQDCFDLFVADVYAAIATGAAPDGLPTLRRRPARGADHRGRARRRPREERWVDVARRWRSRA